MPFRWYFLQQLEGARKIPSRRFGAWAIELMASITENKQLCLKYSTSANFDPYHMSPRHCVRSLMKWSPTYAGPANKDE